MRDVNVYNFRKGLPRMSWHPRNLYNLWRRSFGELSKETQWTATSKTLFQQRWASKALLRAYHGDYINEKIFKRWYLPSTLPDVRPRQNTANDHIISLTKWARKDEVVAKERKRKEEEESKGLAPVGSLMFTEVERRIDVVIFRACLAHSVYEARRMVVHGDVLLNGKKHQNANTRLAPGDMVSVDPKAIRFLQPLPEPPAEKSEVKSEEKPEREEHELQSENADTTSEDVESSESSEVAATESSTPPPVVTNEAKSETNQQSRKKKDNLTPFNLPPYASPFIFVPGYIEPSFATCSAIYLRHPTARPGYSEIPTPYEADGEIVRLGWEWYTRVRPRMRSRRQLSRMPDNRK